MTAKDFLELEMKISVEHNILPETARIIIDRMADVMEKHEGINRDLTLVNLAGELVNELRLDFNTVTDIMSQIYELVKNAS